MQIYQFRCEDCGVLFEGIVYQQGSTISCEFCKSHRVKKLCMVTAPEVEDEEKPLENGC